MAGGGAIIGGGGRDGNVANVVDGRLQVSAIGGGGGGGGLVTQGTIPWVIQEPLSIDDNGGSLTVDGTVAISNFPASQTVDDGGLSLTIDGSVSVSNFPAVQSVDDNGGSLTIDAVALPLPAGASTAALQLPDGHNVTVDNAAGVAAVNVQDGGNSLTIDGTVAISNFPASQTVDDGGGSLTIDGAVTVTGTVAVSNFPAVQSVDDNGGSLSVDDGGGSLTVDGTTSIVENGSVVDPLNSTTIPLAGGGNFTGTYVDLEGYSSVTMTINTDADSATDGIVFEHSTDGVNVDDSHVFNFTANVPRRFQFPTTARFFRINYTSAPGGPGNQSFFRLQTMLITTNVMQSVHRLGDDIDPDRSSQLVNAGILAQVSGAGNFIPIQATSGGGLKVTDTAMQDEGDPVAGPGRQVMAVRDDVLGLPAGVLEGDVAFLRVDDGGALWVRERDQTMILSGSTNGQPIRLTGTNSAGAVTLHNPGAGNTDQVWLFVTNTSTANTILTIEFGGTGNTNEIDIILGGNDTICVVAGSAVSGNNNVRGFCTSANVVNVHGYARRVS